MRQCDVRGAWPQCLARRHDLAELCLRTSGRVSERPLPPHPLDVYEEDSYRKAVEAPLS